MHSLVREVLKHLSKLSCCKVACRPSKTMAKTLAITCTRLNILWYAVTAIFIKLK